MEKVFDEILNDQYGIIYGNKKLVYVKTGRGGNIYGHNNKYVELAHKLHKTYGCSVVISANPIDSECILSEEIDLLNFHLKDITDIVFVGISAGASIGAQQGYLNKKIKRMLLINGPIMINWPKTKRGIERFEGEFVEMIYGTKDPSYGYYEILNCINSSKFRCKSIDGADHNFKGMENILTELIVNFVNE